MKRYIRKLLIFSELRALCLKLFLYPRFILEYFKFKKNSQSSERFSISWKNRFPQLLDRTKDTGFDRHYIYHPAWAARVLARTKPSLHIDISSKLYFSTLVSAFVPIEFYDYRPADIQLSGLVSKFADLTKLPFSDNSVESISCMHTVEHIGLGRYGDPLDVDGDLKAMRELSRVIKKGGQLLFVVPIGKPKLMFNGHRIYSYAMIVDFFCKDQGLILEEFSLIPEKSKDIGIITPATQAMADAQKYGCGCFIFKKI